MVRTEDLELQHSRLRKDIEMVRQYGEAHPNEWTSVQFENDLTVKVVATFSGPNLDLHERALRAVVPHPDQLVVRPAKYSRNEMEETLDKVMRFMNSESQTVLRSGISNDVVRIKLEADQELLAASLSKRFGDAVVIEVGAFEYPLSTASVSGEQRDRADTFFPLLESTDTEFVDAVIVSSGQSLFGTVRLHNRSSNVIVLITNGQLTGRILDPLSDEVIGGYVGMQATPKVRLSIEPEATTTVPMLIGTASFDRSLGFVVPDGDWKVDAIVNVEGLGRRRIQPLPIKISSNA
jgi:hypothetical protein